MAPDEGARGAGAKGGVWGAGGAASLKAGGCGALASRLFVFFAVPLTAVAAQAAAEQHHTITL